jgi:hypothetical protein
VGSAEAGAVEALPRLGDLVTGKGDLDAGIALKLAASAGRHCTEAGGTRLWHSIVEVDGDPNWGQTTRGSSTEAGKKRRRKQRTSVIYMIIIV